MLKYPVLSGFIKIIPEENQVTGLGIICNLNGDFKNL